MLKDTTRRDYAGRIARVYDLIAAHLDNPLDIATLADAACFSPYHFHRIYRTQTGETVTQTVRRFRLHRAATDLTEARLPLSRIARRAGYASQEAFSRAFSAAYGQSPSTYRDRPRHPVAPNTASGDAKMTHERTVTIETRRATRLAGLSHTGPYTDIGASFEKAYAYAGGAGLLDRETEMVGIYYDDPGSVPAKALRSFAGLSVQSDMSPEAAAPMEVLDLPAGRYASVIHKGPYSDLMQTWDWIYGTWLPQSGEDPSEGPGIEVYLNNPRDTAPADLLTAVCVPLKD